MLNHLLHGKLDLANDVVRSMPIRIPKLDTEVFVGLDQLGTNKKSRGFLPDRLEIVGDDTGAVHWFAVLGESKRDVGVATSVL